MQINILFILFYLRQLKHAYFNAKDHYKANEPPAPRPSPTAGIELGGLPWVHLIEPKHAAMGEQPKYV